MEELQAFDTKTNGFQTQTQAWFKRFRSILTILGDRTLSTFGTIHKKLISCKTKA